MKVIYNIGAVLASTGIGSVAYRAVKAINQSNSLNKVICLSYWRNEIPKNKIVSFTPLMYLLYYPLKGIQRYLIKSFDPYPVLDKVYDLLATKKIDSCDIYHGWRGHSYHGLRAAKKYGAITIIQNASTHPVYQNKVINQEYKKYGFGFEAFSKGGLNNAVKEINEADYTLVPSKFAYDSFLQQGYPKEKLIMIPFGIDLQKFSPVKHKPDKKFRAIFVGQVNLRKGIQYLLKAWEELNLANAELLVIGRVLPEAEKIVHTYSKNESIKFIGFTDLRQYYAMSDVFVFPSIEEGSALVNYEAMACGLPIITTPNAGSVARDGLDGFIIPIRNVKKIKEKLNFFYKNPNKARKMGKNARKNIERYTWEESGRKLLEAYKIILAKKNKS